MLLVNCARYVFEIKFRKAEKSSLEDSMDECNDNSSYFSPGKSTNRHIQYKGIVCESDKRNKGAMCGVKGKTIEKEAIELGDG